MQVQVFKDDKKKKKRKVNDLRQNRRMVRKTKHDLDELKKTKIM